MKKLITASLLFIMIATLTACSGKTDLPKLLAKEGIAPYELSESENYILQSFGKRSIIGRLSGSRKM